MSSVLDKLAVNVLDFCFHFSLSSRDLELEVQSNGVPKHGHRCVGVFSGGWSMVVIVQCGPG